MFKNAIFLRHKIGTFLTLTLRINLLAYERGTRRIDHRKLHPSSEADQIKIRLQFSSLFSFHFHPGITTVIQNETPLIRGILFDSELPYKEVLSMLIRKFILASATRQSAGTSRFGTNKDLSSIARRHRASMSSIENEMKNPIAAVAQLRSTSDKFRNLIDIATCARLAKSEGASMLFLPECFGFIGESSSQTLEEAEDPSNLSLTETEKETASDEEQELTRILKSIVHHAGNDVDGSVSNSKVPSPAVNSLMSGLRTIAKESGLWISGGGMHVGGAPPKVDIAAGTNEEQNRCRVYNTHVVLDSSGALVASYRKIHLFDVSIPGKVELRESNSTAPGTELIACDSPVGKLGITTCYDLRFPEMYKELTQKMGAQVLLVPSAFTVPTGAAHWHTLLRGK